MNRFQCQLLYSLFIAITGVFLIALSFTPSRTIQYGVSIGMFLSSFFAFATANKSKGFRIRLKYHWLKGIGLFICGLAILIYSTTFERFITILFAFILYFGITEILFGFELLGYRKKINLQIIVFIMLIGFFATIGSVIILATAFLNKNISLLFAGILIFLSGVNFILFANYTRKLERTGILT